MVNITTYWLPRVVVLVAIATVAAGCDSSDNDDDEEAPDANGEQEPELSLQSLEYDALQSSDPNTGESLDQHSFPLGALAYLAREGGPPNLGELDYLHHDVSRERELAEDPSLPTGEWTLEIPDCRYETEGGHVRLEQTLEVDMSGTQYWDRDEADETIDCDVNVEPDYPAEADDTPDRAYTAGDTVTSTGRWAHRVDSSDDMDLYTYWTESTARFEVHDGAFGMMGEPWTPEHEVTWQDVDWAYAIEGEAETGGIDEPLYLEAERLHRETKTGSPGEATYEIESMAFRLAPQDFDVEEEAVFMVATESAEAYFPAAELQFAEREGTWYLAEGSEGKLAIPATDGAVLRFEVKEDVGFDGHPDPESWHSPDEGRIELMPVEDADWEPHTIDFEEGVIGTESVTRSLPQ